MNYANQGRFPGIYTHLMHLEQEAVLDNLFCNLVAELLELLERH